MPIYEYRCANCGHEFETIQKVSDEPLKTCPACEQDALRKKVTAAGFRLKGGGWYETDFKSDKKRNVAGEQGAGDKSDGAGEKAAGDTTPAKTGTDGAGATGAQEKKSAAGSPGKPSGDGGGKSSTTSD